LEFEEKCLELEEKCLEPEETFFVQLFTLSVFVCVCHFFLVSLPAGADPGAASAASRLDA
jgi:hypothetical protein